MNQTTKYGLFFVGGLVVGALGAVALTKGDLRVKPLASNLLSSGIDLKDKILASVEGVKEDLADVVAEAQVKSQERKEAKEVKEAEVVAAAKEAPVATSTRKPRATRKAKAAAVAA